MRRTPVALIAVAAAAATLAGCGTAPKGPNVFDVGRVHVVMPTDGWQERSLGAVQGRVTSAAADFNHDYSIPRKLIYLPRPQGEGLDGVMYVMTSPGVAASGMGVIADARCGDADPGAYVYDMSGSPTSPGCVLAWNGKAPKDVLPGLDPAEVGPKVKVVRIETMNSLAAQVVILAILNDAFTGKVDASPRGKLPAGFPTDLAAWADVLGREARDATSSLSGTLQVPPGVFH